MWLTYSQNELGAAMEKELTVVQSLTDEQIEYVAKKAGITKQSVIDMIAEMNKNDFIALGIVDLTPDVAIGFSLCEQHYSD